MRPDNLLKVFGQDVSNLEANRVEYHDWQADSINCIYIIFITGRCGSTWLTHLLEDSGICGRPHELFNETMMPRFNRSVGAGNFKEYFAGLVPAFSSDGRFGFKIDEFRFRQMQPLIDFDTLFPKSMTKFFWMTRRDIVDQAFSYGRAKTTGHWHDFTTSQSRTDGVTEIPDALLWQEIIEIIGKESRMEAFFQDQGIKPIPLDYEQMTTDRLLTVLKVMLELQCPAEEAYQFIHKMEDKTLKLPLGNKYRVLGEFCGKYKLLLRTVYDQRSRIDLDDLKSRLQLDYELTVSV